MVSHVCTCSVVIRGDPSEEAVLCTDDKTYELRIADTSNALLITPNLILPKDAGKFGERERKREREREREREEQEKKREREKIFIAIFRKFTLCMWPVH